MFTFNSGLEYAYWNGLHSVPYSSMGWNVAKFLVDWVFSPVIRGAFSTMSCFNHRVSDIRRREDYVKDHPERCAELDALGFRWNSLAW